MSFLTYLKDRSLKALAANAPLTMPPPPDAAADAERMVRNAATMRALARKRAQSGYSRADTILTGAQGLTTAAPTARKTLLGL